MSYADEMKTMNAKSRDDVAAMKTATAEIFRQMTVVENHHYHSGTGTMKIRDRFLRAKEAMSALNNAIYERDQELVDEYRFLRDLPEQEG